ncbi:hypothetical protein M9H77_34789 [Catharanthus roseus]|uniref:Uncharacterized protein n=1 Tax=Catharanthus roseus TaxID=4058 RepID=A0ACB9ZM74_CATRO|nr:hypothetical protein M9H77_34789 [Catharanthus roseus]
MENFKVMPFANVEEFNCDIMNHSSCICDDSLMILIVYCLLLKHQLKIPLVGSVISSQKHAFKLYNDHVFRMGFIVCKGNQKFNAGYFRTGCKVMIEFRLNDEGGWIVSRHDSQVTKNNASYLRELKDRGLSTATGLRVLKKQVGGFPFVGFTSRDAYNILRSKNLDRGDANSVIQIFR